MKKLTTIISVIFLTSWVFISCNEKKSGSQNNTSTDSSKIKAASNDEALSQANGQFYAALNAMFMGNLEPMNAIGSHSKDVSDLGPY